MPVFRVPRAQLEIEVSRLERQGFHALTFTPDGADVLVYSNPLWRAVSPRDTSPIPRHETRPIVERPDWFVESDAVAGETR